MPKVNGYTAEQVIAAISGSGGIKAIIAERLGCHRHTVDRYIANFPTVRDAWEQESETVVDYAETLLVTNIRLGLKRQRETNEPVDASDARWMLDRKGKNRGYATRQEVTGADGGDLNVNFTGLKPGDV